jgi:hypothetical protein
MFSCCFSCISFFAFWECLWDAFAGFEMRGLWGIGFEIPPGWVFLGHNNVRRPARELRLATAIRRGPEGSARLGLATAGAPRNGPKTLFLACTHTFGRSSVAGMIVPGDEIPLFLSTYLSGAVPPKRNDLSVCPRAPPRRAWFGSPVFSVLGIGQHASVRRTASACLLSLSLSPSSFTKDLSFALSVRLVCPQALPHICASPTALCANSRWTRPRSRPV